ncbi:MAG: M15 family metallopeptidase [Bacteroidota bacterium]
MIRVMLLTIVLGLCSFGCMDQNPKQEDNVRNPKATSTAAMETPSENPNRPKIDPEITVDYLMGKFDPSTHEAFTSIDEAFASKKGMFLRKDAYEAFKKMALDARQAGINLVIISATRPFNHQKRIWEAKWSGSRKVDGQDLSKTIADPAARAVKILTYSSMPGTSRHHWGTDFDVNSLEPSYFESGTGKKIYEWLAQNAADYGFCQPYSEKGADRQYGYEEEKWHWSYLPIAKNLTDQYILRINDEDLAGFRGSETAVEIDMIEKWVYGINPSCK